MFHYQLNQNTGCDVKFVVNIRNYAAEAFTNCRHRRHSERLFYLSRVCPWVTPPMMPG